MRQPRPKKYYSNRVFISQIRNLMGIFAINEQKEFLKRVGVQESNFSKWESGNTAPSVETLLAIKKEFGISLNWLLTGEDTHQAGEHMPDVYDARQPAPADLELISEVVAAVEKYLEARRLKIGGKRKGAMISLGYEQCVLDHLKPEKLDIEPLMTLTRLIVG